MHFKMPKINIYIHLRLQFLENMSQENKEIEFVSHLQETKVIKWYW